MLAGAIADSEYTVGPADDWTMAFRAYTKSHPTFSPYTVTISDVTYFDPIASGMVTDEAAADAMFLTAVDSFVEAWPRYKWYITRSEETCDDTTGRRA